MKMREFTNEDYMAFAGAEETAQGHKPMICELDHDNRSYTVIVDNQGLSVYMIHNDSDSFDTNVHSALLPYRLALMVATEMTAEEVAAFSVNEGLC